MTCLPYQVAHDDTFVLSASFREFERRRLVHSDLDKAPHGYLRRPDAAPEPLPGRWFYFDTNVPEHFGHAVTEQLSLVWNGGSHAIATPGCRRWCSPTVRRGADLDVGPLGGSRAIARGRPGAARRCAWSGC